MPFYDLRCKDCDEISNIRATMSEKEEGHIPCPKCGSYNMETHYISAPAYIKSTGEKPPACPSSNTCGNSGCRFAG